MAKKKKSGGKQKATKKTKKKAARQEKRLAKKSARKIVKAAKRSAKKSKSAAKAGRPAGAGRTTWLDEASHTPLIEQHARRLNTFVEALADGRVDDHELQAQEARLVALMTEVEPQLDAETHDKVTQLLCELTAYDLMNVLHELQAARRPTAFVG